MKTSLKILAVLALISISPTSLQKMNTHRPFILSEWRKEISQLQKEFPGVRASVRILRTEEP